MIEEVKHKFPFRKFVDLHKLFLYRMLMLDLMLGICGAVYLVLPSGIFELTLSNLAMLSLVVLTTILFQMHFYREYCGSAVFYLILPVKRAYILPLFFIIMMLFPILITIVLSSSVFLLKYFYNYNIVFAPLRETVFYLSGILLITKALPLTVMLLIRKHFALFPLFLLMIIILYLVMSIIRELVSFSLIISDPVFIFFYMLIVVFICIRIINTADME